jgi:DNA-binding MarR family transcriptional regulator
MKDYDEILVALRRITRAIDLHSKRLQKETGLTTSQLLVMEIISKLGSPSPSTIAREMVLSQATVTSLLDRLTKSELVVRIKSDQDKRSVTVDLTERGRELVSHAPELLQADFLKKYRKLPDWQRHSLIASLQQIAHMMDAEQLDASPILDTGELNHQPDHP